METLTLSDLGPIIAAVLGPMLLCLAALMRYQHVDSTKTRELIAESAKENRDLIDRNRDLIAESAKENRDLIDRNRELIAESAKENRDLIRANHTELSSSLADARERLARIEGYLRISPPPQQGAGDGDGNAKAA